MNSEQKTGSFESLYTVTIGDINYGGHMGNERALLLFQNARIELLAALGYSERDIGEDSGIIMVESGVRYLREVFLGDVLTVIITLGELKDKKVRLNHQVRRHNDGQTVLKGFTAFLAFDYRMRKVRSLPASFAGELCSILGCK